jgi:2Fe-2S ferredoxin
MAKITYTQPDGAQQTVDAEPGMTVMEAAKKHLIAGIEAECGGACSCATCHVYVDEAWRERSVRPPRWRRTCSTSPSTCVPRAA